MDCNVKEVEGLVWLTTAVAEWYDSSCTAVKTIIT